jgi:ribosomal protein L29
MNTLWDILHDGMKTLESGFETAISELEKQITILKQKQAALRAVREMETLDALPSLKKNGRTDWYAVLKQLPREFTAHDVARVSGRSLDTAYSRLSDMISRGKLKKTGKTYAKTDDRQ